MQVRCTVLLGVLAELLPEPDQDPPGEGSLIFEARRRRGLPRGGRLGRLQQRDRQVVGVAVGLHPREAITVLADERVLGPREQALEPEPALVVGQGLDRPGAIAAIEDRRAGDGPAVGADHAAGEVAVDPGQDDRAEVVGLAGLAGDLGRLGLAPARGLDDDLVPVARPEVPEDEPAGLGGRVRFQPAADPLAQRIGLRR